AITLLRGHFPDLKIRMINVVDIFTLIPHDRHPHGFDTETFEADFTRDKPVIFAFHGHPRVIHELTYKRANPHRFHVRGYIEEGTTTTPFDMVVCNQMSRYHLAMEAIHRVPRLQSQGGDFIEHCKQILSRHKTYIYEHGEDLPEVLEWTWKRP
ncbi:MAG: phosphoketolase, partial [Chlamydiia bacterium]|nr:phosphoketolase [Chlamydiia bacterium]